MKKSIKNIIFGLLGQIITIALGLVLPRMFITSYGSEVNGMLSSVNNIFSYLALLEAGIGSATIQALYGPLAKNNRDDINGILSATNLFYKRTGIIYFISVIVFSVVYPLCVTSEISPLTTALVILFIGMGHAVNYFFQGKYKMLLQAEGKQYITSNVTTIVHVFVSVSKIILISLGMSVVAITVAQFLLNIAQMIYYFIYIKRHYKWLDLKVTPNKASISQSKNVVVHQVSNLIFHNTDTLILSIFCGFEAASIYALYNLFFEMISTMLNHFTAGFSYKIGQLCNSDEKKFKRYFEPWEQYSMALSFAMYCVLFIFILPFIKVYTDGADINYYDPILPILFVTIKILVSGRATCGHIISFAGHFKKTQWRSVIEMILNITVSISAVLILNPYGKGLYGVLIGTIVALLYRSNDMIIYSCRHILQRGIWKTYKRWIINIALFVLMYWLSTFINMKLDSYISLILWCIPVTAVVTIVFFAGAFISEPSSTKTTINLLKNKLTSRKSK